MSALAGLSGVGALIARPSLWPTAARTWVQLVPRRWWTRRPFLPVPDRAYLRFRHEAMYGDPERSIDGDDLVQYLEWCRRHRKTT